MVIIDQGMADVALSSSIVMSLESDTIAIVAVNAAQIDALLQQKWNGKRNLQL